MVKSKVGILTFHAASSYGAVLQTYALKKTVEELNFDAEIIDYRELFKLKFPTGLWSLKHNYNKKRIKNLLLFRKFSNKHFASNSKVFNKSKDLNEIGNKYDIYIVGSDQVWNTDITKKNALVYFFDFVQSGKKISYAASFGNENLKFDPTLKEKISKLLSSFHAISVREENAIDIIKNEFQLNSQQVLDPTLLYSMDNYCKDFQLKDKPSNELVVFKLHFDKVFEEFIEKISVTNKLNTKVIAGKAQSKNIQSIEFPKIHEWLNSIKNAKYVITDSFHGLAFCLIFNKNFVVINANRKRFVRLQSLLNSIGLENRILEEFSEENFQRIIDQPIDYKIVNPKLNELKNNSILFLKTNLG